jgi:hypothetical protein
VTSKGKGLKSSLKKLKTLLDTQLGKKAGFINLVGSWLKTLLSYINRSVVILIYYVNIDKTDIKLYFFFNALLP